MSEIRWLSDFPLMARLPQVRLGNRYEELETLGLADRNSSSLCGRDIADQTVPRADVEKNSPGHHRHEQG